MLKTTVTFTVNPNGACAKQPDTLRKALAKVSQSVLADCNRYARDNTGALIASSYAASDVQAGRLVWNTPYARRVYYTGTPKHGRNPGASLRWCQKAKALHVQTWTRLAAQLMGGENK